MAEINRGSKPRIVILGGGFGGLYTARALDGAPAHVTVVDRHNYHLFQPLLYEVATAALSPGDIAGAIRAILRKHKNVTVWMGDVRAVDVERGLVHLTETELPYDYLVVATGSTHAYFDHPEWEREAPGLKTIDDATEIRRRFLLAFESAERESDQAARRRLITFVIVGGGPTGVELAGAMAEMAHRAIRREYEAVDTSRARVLLVEALPRILPTYPPELSEKARRRLTKLGVEVRTDSLVSDIKECCVWMGEEKVPAGNVFWAAGVAASPVGKTLGVPLDKAGRVLVQPDCTIPGHPEVFVIGDLAHLEQDGRLVPGLAAAAIQMGDYVAKQIRRDLAGTPREPFRYVDKGSLAVIGRGAAVAHRGRVMLSGFVAWLMWLFVHIVMLIGFRNRLAVMVDWAWAYVSWQRGVRLITGEPRLELARARSGAEVTPGGGPPPPPSTVARGKEWARRAEEERKPQR